MSQSRSKRFNLQLSLGAPIGSYQADCSSIRPRKTRDIDSDGDDDIEDGEMSGGEEYAELEIDPADHATLDALVAPGQEAGSRTLADMIFDKMQGGAVTQGMDDEGELISLNVARKPGTRLTSR